MKDCVLVYNMDDSSTLKILYETTLDKFYVPFCRIIEKYTAVAIAETNELRICSMVDAREIAKYKFKDPIRTICSLGEAIYIGFDSEVVKLSIDSPTLSSVISLPSANITSIQAISDSTLFLCCIDGGIAFVNTMTGEITSRRSVRFPPTCSYLRDNVLVIGCYDGHVLVIGLIPEFRIIMEIQAHTRPVNTVAIMEDGTVISGSSDSLICMIDPKAESVQTSLMKHSIVTGVISDRTNIYVSCYDYPTIIMLKKK
ncbi:hypothetical protein ADUPG1_006002 [Aduncisulcus paluster]|uniref:Uncharacterized protein n=1 Tax=Aduncisulcus paluster TaxID=2918883 RepID=A0ABQ5KI89_9EUKA|nr:hypothetical protein ADUPG1_006002 [Aduncisulcus paluster]